MQVQAQTVQPRLEQRTTKPEEVQKKPQVNTSQAQGHQNNDKSDNTEKTSAYAKVLSRIENIEGDPALKEKAVEIFSSAIERRLKEVTDQEREQILTLDAVEELEIEKVEDLTPKIKEGLLNDEKKKEILALLKNPKFMEFMQDKPSNDAKTYSPQPSETIKEKSAEVEKHSEQNTAMQKIKTTQAANVMKASTAPIPTRQTVA